MTLEVTTYKDQKARDWFKRYRYALDKKENKVIRKTKGRIALVFADYERPFNRPEKKAEFINEDFKWRREHVEPIKSEYLKRFLVKKGVLPKESEIKYDRKAGCSCGCSPGYIVYGDYTKQKDPEIIKQIWVKKKSTYPEKLK